MACDIVKYVAVWYWKSNENPCSMNEIETWQNYSAIDNEMIENEFKKNAKHIILDEYIIDFEKLIQTNKDHSNGKKERPVKRILEDVTTHPRNINYKERLYSTELPEKTIGNINWNCWYEEKSLKRMPPNCGKFIREWLYQLLPEYIEWTPEDYQQYVTALARGFVQTKHPQYISDVIQNPRKAYPSGSNVLTKLSKELSTSKSIWVIYPRSTGYLTDDSEYLQLLECAHQISHETNTPLVTTIEDYPTILKRNGGSTAGYRRARGTWQITEEHKMEWLEYVVKEAAQGIIEEGEKVGKLIAAKYIADALLQAFKDDDLWRCCIYLYTLESFLYRCINRALRDEDITKLKSLGPYCYLLHWSLIGDQSVNVSNNKEKQLFTGIVYRGMNLEEWAIESYKTAKDSYRSWPAFTSTTKNREIASLFGNVLFIIDIQNDVFISQDISMVSQMKDEEEVLLRAGTIFKILDIEYDTTEEKHLIYLVIGDLNYYTFNVRKACNKINVLEDE
ncbi:unnamed protein product [Rotaria sp. Silwood1]|nr:unnamed protein product [Rotaria sp. Silwood1]CAF1438104.1 unnamed protein product [Rotaria sp. Silwood1]